MKKPQQSLVNWTRQDWRTKSGKPSGQTGERYLPASAIKALTPAEYASTTAAKRKELLLVSNSSSNLKRYKKRQQSSEEVVHNVDSVNRSNS
jgi:hypothetical protein